eukprot:4742028-Amphidinium_carterae.1
MASFRPGLVQQSPNLGHGTGQDIHLHRPGTGQDIYICRTAVTTRFLKESNRSGYTSTASALGGWGFQG